MNDEEFKKLKMIELDILKETIRICQKHNIEFFATAGTALGAYFFNGIMPWDDDIDIGMRRSEYERFIKIAEKELSDEYFLQTRKTDKNYPFNFAKIKKKNTSYVQEAEEDIKMHHGIFIDIFPFDSTTWDKKKRFIQTMMIYSLEKLLVMKYKSFKGVLKTRTTKKIKCTIIRVSIALLLKLLSEIIPAKLLDKTYQYCCSKYSLNGESCLCELRAIPMNVFVDAHKMYPLINFKFEDVEIPMLNNHEELFRNQYGNFVKYPPEEKRVIRHKPIYCSFINEYIP